MKLDWETIIESVIVIAIFAGLLYLGPGSIARHSLDNSYPVQYGATDGFSYLMLSEWAYDSSQYRYNPPYESGGFSDAVAYHPPLFMQLSAVIAHTTGLAIYDTVALLLGLAIVMGAFTFFVIVRAYNRRIAILSLPVLVFLFKGNFAIGYMWGECLLILGTYFLIVLFLLLEKESIDHFWILTGILIAATILTHTAETIFFYGFVAFLFFIRFVFRHLSFKDVLKRLKPLAFATILACVISFYYFPIFYNGYYKFSAEKYTTFQSVSPEEYSAIRSPIYDKDFPLFLSITFALGAIAALLFILKKDTLALIAGGFMFLVGFTNYVGLNYRAFQTRFFWPVYVSVFFGLVVYLLIKYVLRIGKEQMLYVAGGVSLAFFILFVVQFYQPLLSGAIYPEQYAAFQWVDQRTPATAKVLLLYGDGYSQSGRIIKRLSYQFLPDEYSKLNVSRRSYRIQNFGLEVEYMYQKDFFHFGYHGQEANLSTEFIPMDICGFDYYVIDRASAYAQPLAQANVMIAQLFLKNGMQQAYVNDLTVILKNPNPGGDCFAQ